MLLFIHTVYKHTGTGTVKGKTKKNKNSKIIVHDNHIPLV